MIANGKEIPGAGPAQVLGRGARGLGRRCRVGDGQRVSQVQQRAAQLEAVAGLGGQPRALA